jgi:hypothetical protein
LTRFPIANYESMGINKETIKYIDWQDGNFWMGYLEEYPDYMTQWESIDELKENLKDLYSDLTSGEIPCVRKVGELKVA